MRRFVVIASFYGDQQSIWRGRGMRGTLPSLTGCLLVCGLMGLAVCVPAWAGGSLSLGGMGSSPFESSLVVPGALVEAEELQAQEQARRMSPAAVVAREESQLKYSELSSTEAGKVAQEVFPALIDEPAGGPSRLPAGESIASFPAVNAARVVGEGEHGVIESAEPIAVESSPGQRVPIDLGLSEAGGAFEPKTPVVGVRVPKRLSDGVALPAVGVSLTPVDGQGSPLGGEGSVVGATVLYANTQTDADTVVKPTTLGFDVDTLLRSAHSPQQLDYRVGLPQGASLVQEAEGSGSVRVVDDGETIAEVVAPSAGDAEGTSVPVSMRVVSGDVLAVTVARFADAAYRMPIAVDPEIEDEQFSNESLFHTEWHFEHLGSAFTAPEQPEGGSWTEIVGGSHTATEWGGLSYTTRGASQIMRAEAMGHWNDTGSHIQNYMVLYAPKHTESYSPLPAEAGAGSSGYVCAPEKKCPETVEAGSAENNNTAAYEQESTGAGEGHSGSNTLTNASVYIKQEQKPEVSFNTTSSTIYDSETKEYLPNVLYGSGSWLGPHSGAYEVNAKDPGIGLSFYAVTGGGAILDDRDFYLGWPPGCAGVQCPPEENQKYLYNSLMANGEGDLEAFVEDEAGLYATAKSLLKVKVDATPPHGIKVSGFVNGDELLLGETHLEVEATDGEGMTKSSGMQSIKVSVDGKEVPGTSASCPEGPCSASTKVTLFAKDYSSGQHSLVVTATDNADNVVQEEFAFRVHGASPVSVGPGSVDPSTGEFTLSASDVSLGGLSGVSRSYQSRHLTAGAEGPLGPQWAVDLGGGENLTVLPNGSAVVATSGGARTSFTRNEKGEFESPKGDGDLKLEGKEGKAGKGISEYILSDSTADTKTKFEQPAGMQSVAPSVAGAFGPEAKLSEPVGEAIDPSGDLWVANYASDLVERFSGAGALLGTYGSAGIEGGQYTSPWGIAVNAGGDVYVSDLANDRVEELSSSGAFLRAFGWGVLNGKSELEVCSEAKECRAGLAGSGNGQLSAPHGVAIDASGDVWVADCNNNRIEEFSSTGGYMSQAGSSGAGSGQMSCPAGIAFSGGDLYVADYGNDRVDEFSEKGAFVAAFGWGVSKGEAKLELCTSSCKAGIAGSGAGQLNGPNELASEPATGDLYVADKNNERVVQFSSAGAFLDSFGSKGSGEGQFEANGPQDVAVSLQGVVYVTDTSDNRVEMWSRPTWVPSEVGGPLAASTTTYAYTVVEEEGRPELEPKEALAPTPAGASSCAPKLERGCRALTFKYASSTTATGEDRSQWGEYKGRLVQVDFTGWEPAKGAMSEPIAVADYSYDSKGRLRAEWDPRISPALKTVYGYDAEGHVTALSLPAQESWALTYGMIAGDANTGRLMKATQAPATAELWKGEPPKNTEVPKLSGSAVVGVTLGVSNGVWSNAPVAYAYQWEDCNSSGKECAPILGATNANYTAASKDVGHTLVAQVEATSGGGSVVALSAPSAVVASTGTKTEGEHYAPGPGSTIEYGTPVSGSGAPYELSSEEVEEWGQRDDPVEGMELFPPDEPQGWPASGHKRATVHYWDSQGRMVNTATPAGGIATSEYNETNEVVRTLSADNRAVALKEGSKSAEAAKKLRTESKYNGETKEEKEQEEKEGSVNPGARLLETIGPEHKVKLASGSEVQARNHVKYYYDEGSPGGKHYGLVTKTTDGAQYEGKEADVRMTATSYSGQEGLGWTLRKPTSVTQEPGGLNLTTTTVYNSTTGNVVETRSPGSESAVAKYAYASAFGSAGHESGEFNGDMGVAIDSSGNIWVADTYNNRIEEFSPEGKVLLAFGKEGTGAGEFKEPRAIAFDSKGDVWVSDFSNRRVQEFSSTGAFIKMFGWGVQDKKEEAEVCTSACYAGIQGGGKGEFWDPYGLAFDSKGNVWVADTGGNRVEEFSSEGKYITEFGSKGSEKGQLDEPRDVAFDSKGDIWVADSANNRIQEFSTTTIGEALAVYGSAGSGPGQFNDPVALTFDSKGNLWVADMHNNRFEELSSSGTYMQVVGSKGSGNGQLDEPRDLIFDSKGNIWVADMANDRVEEWAPGNAAAHDARTIYYTAKEEAEVSTCRNHPEWAGLPCETTPAAQPDTSGLPELSVDTYTYNIWDEIGTTTEEFVSATKTKVLRTKTQTYDPAGRALTSETSSSIDTTLPKVTNEYNSETGALTKQSATIKGETKAITSKYNTLGQLVEYTDAEGATTKYAYDVDGRTQETSYELPGKKAGENIASQVYSYDPTSGLMTKLVDTSPGASMTFTASYDVEGNMTSEIYPNGMCANTVYNQAGQAISLEYIKTRNCQESKPPVWFSDTVIPSIHGETLQQNSTLASESYTYDNAGRLTQVQETPAGKGCTTRLYSYDEESNRTSLTTREPGSEGKCATEGGTVEAHSYDTANRLIDPGVSYETFGNTTTLPATDADGHELTSEYYVDNQIAAQKQNEETIKYLYDPAGRTMETVSEGKTAAKTISHYAGPGEALTWTNEGSEKWTRNVPGIGGSLVAIQKSGGQPILQLRDLKGNIVATAALSETETKLFSTYNSTEFGVPQPGTIAPPYSWLGALDISSELPTSGTVTTGASSYEPEIGRPLQTEPAASPGAFPDGTGGAGIIGAPYLGAENGQLKTIAVEHEAELEKAKNLEAEERAKENECGASACGTSEGNPVPTEGGAEGPEEDGGADPSEGPNPWGCSVSVSWEHSVTNYLGGIGHWKCNVAPPDMEVQVAIFLVVNGVKIREGQSSPTVWRYPGELGPTGSQTPGFGIKCNAGSYYQIRVWGRTWDAFSKRTNFVGKAYDGHEEQCPSEIDIELPPGE